VPGRGKFRIVNEGVRMTLLNDDFVPLASRDDDEGHRDLDRSSPVFLVDHSACILCDRCSRACDGVKNNNVIPRNGKGATAAIAFDLNDEMGESSCDLCDAEGELEEPKPRCVYACPHDSAHRMIGEELLKRVAAQTASEV
jgi:predicted molibdopterin-dependent oxidoreductase YjgC